MFLCCITTRMRRYFLAFCALSIILFIPVNPAFALTPQEEAAQAAERLQREQQERMQQQLLKDAARRHETTPIQLPAVTKPSLPTASGCRDVREIVLAGVTLLPDHVKEELTASYRGKCLSVGDIEKMLSEILKAYIDRGYIAVRPYIRAQDLSSGVLEILVVEGGVEKIMLEDGGKQRINMTTAFPLLEGKPLNLRDIEQGLDQVNRLASNNATMQVRPGTKAGDSIIAISNKPAFPASASITMDNLGSRSTGKAQLGGTISLDSPLWLNDFLTYTHRESILENRDKKLSKMDSAFYSIPFGYALFSLAYNHSEYLTTIKAALFEMTTTGTSDSYTGRLDWVAYRDQNQKLTSSAAFTYKSSKNYLNEDYLGVSSRDLAILDLDLNWNGRMGGSIVNLGIGYSQGLAVFDALKDQSDAPNDYPHAQGGKIRYSAGIFYPLDLVGKLTASFSSQLSGQYALEALYGSEQVSIGSYYSVRGFDLNSLSGDRGHYIRNEFVVTIPETPISGMALRPFVGLDAGRIEQYNSTRAATLVGFAAGLRYSGKYLSGELSLAQPISAPSDMKMEPTLFYATLALMF